jgi:selenocysteine-specific elongation factor
MASATPSAQSAGTGAARASATEAAHLVVGTSGHIDHGKTTLVKALTGVDTDRLAEEKARGITIDLGFARYHEGGLDLAFVDVPGHERFVHNMLAGAAGMDAVLMVIAADEGVMPQTREHLAICDLLGIRQGIIALTRVDLVDAELLALCVEDVRAAVKGTFLAQAPIVPLSSVTGQGLPQLKAELAKLTSHSAERNPEHPFRFPVDRSFTIKGFGTVVTGTVIAGKLAAEQEVIQYPAGHTLRVRGIQVHGAAVAGAEAGQRAALNIANVAKEDIVRGDQLAERDTLATSYLLNVELRLLKDIPRDLTQRTRVRMHLGTKEAIGRIVLLTGDAFQPGETQLIQVRLETPVSTRFGDRFIVRNYSPLFTLGGGRIIDPAPNKSRRIRHELAERLRALAGDDPGALVEQAIYLQATRGIRGAEAFVRTGMSERQFSKVLAPLLSQGTVVQMDPVEKKFVHAAALDRVGRFVERVLAGFHTQHPEREGMTRAELAGKLSLIFNEREVAVVLQRMVKQNRIVQTGGTTAAATSASSPTSTPHFALIGHSKSVSGAQQTGVSRLVALVQQGGAQPVRRTALFESAGVDEKAGQQLLNLAAHEGLLVRVKDDLYYVPETLATIEARLREHLKANGKITVIEFKDLAGITRKHAVDLLEHFDAQRITLRLEDHRVLRQAS